MGDDKMNDVRLTLSSDPGQGLTDTLRTLCLMAVLILDDMTVNGQRLRTLRARTRIQGPGRLGWWSVSPVIEMTRSDEYTTRKILELLREGRSDARIAKRLGLSRDEVRATIQQVIDNAHLDDQVRVAFLAEQVGIARDNKN